MSSNKMPRKSQQDIEDFLTFLAEVKSNPETDSQLWENLKVLAEKLATTEDKPGKLATTIKTCCREYGISLNREELAQVRISMLKNGQVIPKPAEGEKPGVVGNKALLVEQVNEASNQKSP